MDTGAQLNSTNMKYGFWGPEEKTILSIFQALFLSSSYGTAIITPNTVSFLSLEHSAQVL